MVESSVQEALMPKSKTFEEQYPTIHRFVEEIGWIEIGQHEVISSLCPGIHQRRNCL